MLLSLIHISYHGNTEKNIQQTGRTPESRHRPHPQIRRQHAAQPRTETPILGPLPRGRATAGRSPRQLIDRGTVRARITREQLDFMAQLKGIARNLNQLTRLANAKGLDAIECL